jgi:beta-phosphoglucomutase-like phosphatase (HAD superfamily)
LRAAQLLQTEPEACLVLEDSEIGVLAAKAAGMHVFAVQNLCPITDKMRENADASSHRIMLY